MRATLLMFRILCSFLLIHIILGIEYEEYKEFVREDRNGTANLREFNINYLMNKVNAMKKGSNVDDQIVFAESTILVGICGQYDLEICRQKMHFLEDILALRLNAILVLIEHRYYGKSLPDYAFTGIGRLRNLRVLDVLEDIRQVVEQGIPKQLKLNETVENIWKRTLLVGTEYAGALALWMGMERDGKIKPKYIWSASPSPLAFLQDAPLSPRFDNKLAHLLEQFNCQPDWFRSLFQWMNDTATAGGANDTGIGLKTVKSTMLYRGDGDIETVKSKVLEWLRQFVAWTNVPTAQKRRAGGWVHTGHKKYWPLERFCADLSNASADGESLAKAFAATIKHNAPFESDDDYDYDNMLLNPEQPTANAITAKNFQRCTELAQDNCAEGDQNDPFFAQCKDPDHLKTMCVELLKELKYDPDNPNSKLQLDFIDNTFGFEFERLENMLITSGELDQFVFPKDLIKSNAPRKVTVIQSIGLSARGHELDHPNACDSVALKQARTQIVDLLVCIFFPSKCVPTNAWPYPLDDGTLASDAIAYNGICSEQWWDYPWAKYTKDGQPGPGPQPNPDSGNGTNTTNGATVLMQMKQDSMNKLSILVIMMMMISQFHILY